MTKKNNPDVFFPYQVRWLADDAPIKIWEKSRQIGATWVAACEDVTRSITGKTPAAWFSSSDESAAREYITYCAMWAKVHNVVAEDLGERLVDEDRDIKTHQIRFASGGRIHAMSSNPRALRSKRGDITLDEFAWHDDAKAMWAAAEAVAGNWNGHIRIMSTHNGGNSLFYKFIRDIKKGELDWSLHTTTIHQAVAEGLADRIMRKPLTDEERAAWIAKRRAAVAIDEIWQQEYCGIPQDETTAFLPYDLIRSCEAEKILIDDLATCAGDLYVGVDIGRIRDLTVIWIVERIGGFLVTRKVIELRNEPFRAQKAVIDDVLRLRTVRRACMDSTGLGMQLVEDAQRAFGQYRVEAVTFTAPVKEELAYTLRTRFDDKAIQIPPSHEIREDLHSIRRMTTKAGNIRFDSDGSADGHADRFWALALAAHAAGSGATAPLEVVSRPREREPELERAFYGENRRGKTLFTGY